MLILIKRLFNKVKTNNYHSKQHSRTKNERRNNNQRSYYRSTTR
jgi:hypothetical protein